MNQLISLYNGVEIPRLGFGTFKLTEGEEAVNAVRVALDAGYRHFDCAAIYKNEVSVGKAIAESGIPREELFITSKVWNSDQGYETTLQAFEATLERLGMEYLDLYLIHWPKALNRETWRALEALYKEKRVRAIGVSNFKVHHIEDLMEVATIKPMINQVELHPRLVQEDLIHYCEANEICVEAWGPLMQGHIFKEEVMITLAKKYNRSISQIALRWHLQLGVVTIPKSANPERIKENFDIFDFQLSDEDMQAIEAMNSEERVGPDPDHITF